MAISRTHRLITRLLAQIQAEEGRRVTAREVAEYLGVRPTTLSKWQSGTVQLEQVDLLLRLFEKLPEHRWLPELRIAMKETKASGD